MKKMLYMEPDFEVITFEAEDIMLASGGEEPDNNVDGDNF